MLSNIFGFLGAYVAPTPGDLKELASLAKGGQNDKAMELLVAMRDSGELGVGEAAAEVLNSNMYDGLNVLHLAAWNGALAIVVELISLGADVNAVCSCSASDKAEITGSRPLHFASMGGHKHVVEVLMRSGADPSCPNEQGQIAYDVCSVAQIRSILLVDRSEIVKKVMSPMQQARRDLNALTLSEQQEEQREEGEEKLATQPAPVLCHGDSMGDSVDGDGDGDRDGDDMVRRIEDTSALSPSKHPLVPALDFSALPGGKHDNNGSNLYSSSGGSGGALDSPGAIAPFPPSHSSSHATVEPRGRRAGQQTAPIDIIAEEGGYNPNNKTKESHIGHHNNGGNSNGRRVANVVNEKHIYSNSPRKDYRWAGYGGYLDSSRSSVPSSSSDGNPTPITSGRNSNGRKTVAPPPPPTDGGGDYLRHYGGGMHGGRGGSYYPPNGGIGGYNYPPDGSDATSSRSVTDSSGESYDFDRGELEAAVLLACTETSAAYVEKDLSYDDRLFLFKSCQPPPKDVKQVEKTLDKLRVVLERRPALVHSRCIELGNLAKDGQTMLHAAAFNGNVPVLALLLEVEGATAWVRDLQGRTPLHCGAENVSAIEGNIDICRMLREKMRSERPSRDPVGENAPLDLAGRTPLGRQNREKVSYQPSKDLQEVLFAEGDKSVLPNSPINARSGHSPVKSPVRSPSSSSSSASASSPSLSSSASSSLRGGGYDIEYAFSEASGWRHYMEDRVLAVCPFFIASANNDNNNNNNNNNNNSSSSSSSNDDEMMGLFGICDGHGGSFVSQFLVDEVPALVQQELQMAGGKGPERLHMAMMSSCLSAEKKLQEHPRMAVDLKPVKGVVFNPESGQPLNPKPADSSGSTGLFCLVTPSMFVIANVGDSRAVVAKSNITAAEASKAATAVPESATRISSPFGHSLASSSSSSNGNGNGNSNKNSDSNNSGASVVELKWASVDHKCSDEGEKARIEAAGLTVATHATSGGSQMKLGSETISMSRSFADFTFKQSCSLQMYEQALVAVPDVHVFERSNEDAFVVLACDGVYDVMSNEEVVAFFAEKLGYTSGTEPVAFVSPLASRTSYSFTQRGGAAAGATAAAEGGGARARGTSQAATTAACDALLKECLKRGSGDNMSVLLILLGEPPEQATATSHAPVSVPAATVDTTSSAATVTANDTADDVVPRRSDTTPMRALPPPPPITLSPSIPPSLETAKQLQF